METNEFLKALYGELSEGWLSVSIIDKGTIRTRWFSHELIDEMVEYISEVGTRYNTYCGINPRKKKLGEKARGVRNDISAVIGTYIDFDIKSDAHKEKRLPENAEELYTYLQSLPEKPTIIVSTGNGVHSYWLFEKPHLIKDEDDRKYIERILKGWEGYVQDRAFNERGWKFDSVSDLPRMLRTPGTLNFKTESKPLCEVVESSSVRYSASVFESYIEKETSIPKAQVDIDDIDLMGTGSGRELIEKCTFMLHCRDEAATLPEPLWYAGITNLAQTLDGRQVIHEISKPYPGYTYSETDKKYLHAVKENKPVTCDYIKNKLGFSCGKNCGVKTPVTLVHTHQVKTSTLWDTPVPFDECNLPAFPVDAFPKPIRDYVSALAESTQTPVDMAATSALPIMSVCLQGKYKVQAKADWYEPLSTYILNVMEPSERKSAVENAMVRPINKYESEVNMHSAAAVETSKMHKRILERRQKALEDQASKGKEVKADLDKIAVEIAEYRELKPLRLYVDDITTEKLTSVLADNGGRAAILSTEGGIFDTLAGIYTKNVNIDVILKGYSGDCIKVDRVSRSSESVMNPALTILLMVQPSVLSGLMHNSTFRGRGLTARFLYCIPASSIGKRKYRSVSVSEDIYRAYEARIRNLLEDEYSKEPEIITLSPEADDMIEAFAEELEPKLKQEYADILDWAGKLVGNTLRIAGLLCRASVYRSHEFLDEPEPLIVDGQTMNNAIRIGRYFIEHARAAFSLMGADITVKQSQYVLNVIKKSGLVKFNRREIMRLCRSYKKTDEIQPILDNLVDYGYISLKDAGVYSGKGRPPAQSYLVNPCIYESDGEI